MPLADTLWWVLPQVFWAITNGSQHGLKTMNRHYCTLLFLFLSLSVTLTVQLGTALSLITDASAWHLGYFQTLLVIGCTLQFPKPNAIPEAKQGAMIPILFVIFYSRIQTLYPLFYRRKSKISWILISSTGISVLCHCSSFLSKILIWVSHERKCYAGDKIQPAHHITLLFWWLSLTYQVRFVYWFSSFRLFLPGAPPVFRLWQLPKKLMFSQIWIS